MTGVSKKDGAECEGLASASGMADRLDLIEAVIFELLRQATPDEAIPFVARRLASRLPTYTEAEITERLAPPTIKPEEC